MILAPPINGTGVTLFDGLIVIMGPLKNLINQIGLSPFPSRFPSDGCSSLGMIGIEEVGRDFCTTATMITSTDAVATTVVP